MIISSVDYSSVESLQVLEYNSINVPCTYHIVTNNPTYTITAITPNIRHKRDEQVITASSTIWRRVVYNDKVMNNNEGKDKTRRNQ